MYQTKNLKRIAWKFKCFEHGNCFYLNSVRSMHNGYDKILIDLVHIGNRSLYINKQYQHVHIKCLSINEIANGT